MYRIKDLKEYTFIPNDDDYVNDEWYVNTVKHVLKVLIRLYGKREINIDYESAFKYAEDNDVSLIDGVVEEVKQDIDSLFVQNREAYIQMYRTLNMTYNPIYNVDGTETLTYTRNNTGTVKNNGSNTGTVQNSGSDTGTVTTSTTNTGTIRQENSNNKTDTESATTYDSAALLTREQNASIGSENNLQTNNLAEDSVQTNNLANANTRTDNLAHSDTRQDNLSESYSETKVRSGNIGVTMTQQMIEAELTLRSKYNFLEMICKDIANCIGISVY